MNSYIVSLYNDLILSIKCGNGISGKSIAKPLFILSIFECIAMGDLNENKIMFNDNRLKKIYTAFARYYEEYYTDVVDYSIEVQQKYVD